MARDAQATKERLLKAAADEFGAYGIAGARVDRIAQAAQSNKAQIYHYFESKDKLFDAVFDELVVTTVNDVPLDPDNLPGYAGRLFDYHHRHPAVLRLSTWHQLERGTTDPLPQTVADAERAKIAALATAQDEGRLSKRFEAADLLALVVHLSTLGATTYATTAPDNPQAIRRRRRAVIEAVARVVQP
ncbi:MAG: TetR family transcriptional regulator [Solirubrobacteraceae bacterium]